MIDPLDQALAIPLRRAMSMIAERTEEAHAFALVGNLAAATQRLARLQVSLTGPEGSGLIGDARATFYRDVYRIEPFDPELHDLDRHLPTAEAAKTARTVPIGGKDAWRELAAQLEQARGNLIAAYGQQAADAGNRRAALATWQEQTRTALQAWARRTLSDSQITIHHAVGRLRLKPEYRDET